MTPAQEKKVERLCKNLIAVKRRFADALKQAAKDCSQYCTGLNDQGFCARKLKEASAANALGRRLSVALIELRISEGFREGKALTTPKQEWRDPWETKVATIPPRLIHRTSDGRDLAVTADILIHLLDVPVSAFAGRRLAAAMRCNGWRRNASDQVKVAGKNFKGYWRFSEVRK